MPESPAQSFPQSCLERTSHRGRRGWARMSIRWTCVTSACTLGLWSLFGWCVWRSEEKPDSYQKNMYLRKIQTDPSIHKSPSNNVLLSALYSLLYPNTRLARSKQHNYMLYQLFQEQNQFQTRPATLAGTQQQQPAGAQQDTDWSRQEEASFVSPVPLPLSAALLQVGYKTLLHQTPLLGWGCMLQSPLFLSNPKNSLYSSLPPLCLSWQQAVEDLIRRNSLSLPVSMLGQASHLPSRSQRILCSQTWCSPQCHLQSSPGHAGLYCPVCLAPGAWLFGEGCLEDIPPPQAGWYKQPRRGEVHLKRLG